MVEIDQRLGDLCLLVPRRIIDGNDSTREKYDLNIFNAAFKVYRSLARPIHCSPRFVEFQQVYFVSSYVKSTLARKNSSRGGIYAEVGREGGRRS